MKSKVIDGVEITELIVRDVYDWLTDYVAEINDESKARDVKTIVQSAILEDMPLNILERMTSLDMKKLEAMPPSTLDLLAKECKAKNPFFFRLRAGVMTGDYPPLSNAETSDK